MGSDVRDWIFGEDQICGGGGYNIESARVTFVQVVKSRSAAAVYLSSCPLNSTANVGRPGVSY